VPLSLKRLLLGRPLHSNLASHERLSIPFALPIFASDALSSTAYATEAILIQLAEAHVSRTSFFVSLPISMAIVSLILMVVVSYTQVIRAYPQGGGSYIVAKENLGRLPGLAGAAALLVDYILTVAVSISEGTAAALAGLGQLGGVFETLPQYRVLIACMLILGIMLMNLRGTRESGLAFAIPSYYFIICMLILVGYGVPRALMGAPVASPVAPPSLDPVNSPALGLSFFLLLRAFSSGCAALTGIEAVSTGVQAFKPPEARNASITLVVLGVLLATIFTSITFIANHYNIVPGSVHAAYGGVAHQEPVVSQVTRATFGLGTFYYMIQAAVAMILLMAANTAFSGFPRLASILARDNYLPRYFGNLGDRLAYNNGIIVQALLAMSFVVVFGGQTHALLPLYTVGVFIAFTLSQAGMVARWTRQGKFGLSFFINLIGCIITGVVLVVVGSAKFWVSGHHATLFHIGGFAVQEGAWIALVLMSLVGWMCYSISRHYESIDAQLAHVPESSKRTFKHTVIVLVPSRIHRGVYQAVNYARSISDHATAVHIAFDAGKEEHLRQNWEVNLPEMPLIILESPYRSLVKPLMRYLDAAGKVRADDIVTVILPEFVPAKWYHHFLHNASGWLLRIVLFYRRDIVITSIRYYLDE
jgi:amino acid transporter